jgi:uncharacterized protein YxjI
MAGRMRPHVEIEDSCRRELIQIISRAIRARGRSDPEIETDAIEHASFILGDLYKLLQSNQWISAQTDTFYESNNTYATYWYQSDPCIIFVIRVKPEPYTLISAID